MQQLKKFGKTVIIAKEEKTEKISVIVVNILPEGVTIRPQVKTSGTHTITLKSNGTVWSYGQNEFGELGNGNKDYSDDPSQAIFPERNSNSSEQTVGENFSVALDSEGNLWTWGANNYGELGRSGDGTLPAKVEGISNVTKIACGNHHVFALTRRQTCIRIWAKLKWRTRNRKLYKQNYNTNKSKIFN